MTAHLPRLCLCSHRRDRHEPDAAGRPSGKCRAPLCGCDRYRTGVRATARDAATEEGDAA